MRAGVLGMRERGIAPAPIKGGGAPVTVEFASSAVTAGLYGPTDIITTAGRRYMRASKTIWWGYITGTDAVMNWLSTSGSTANAASVSVDGGAFTNVNRVSGKITLFSGLSDTRHLVGVRVGTIYGNNTYFLTSGDVLSVTGVNPSLEVLPNKMEVGQTGVFSAAALSANGGNFVPQYGIRYNDGNSVGASIGCLAFTGSPTKLHFASSSNYVLVSVDGAAPTVYATSSGGVEVACDGNSHTYFCWDGGRAVAAFDVRPFSVGADVALSAIGTQKRIHHFSHSIGYGALASSSGHTDMGRTAARNGYIWNNLGVSGNSIADLAARIDAALSYLTVTASDVAIIDIGRNDPATALDTTAQTNYEYIIDACAAKGYGTILCLAGLIDVSWDPYTGGQAASMESIVTGKSDPGIVYIDRSNYTGIARGDDTHPTDAGYVTIDGFNETYIDPEL